MVGLFSLADADELLTESAIRAPSVRIVQDGTVLPESRYTRAATLAGRSLSGLVDPRKALDFFDAGATIVFQGLHRYWPPLTRLIADLELALGHPCQANAYLTPPASQGFAVHSDSHDVFVFQTHGRKCWELPGAEHTPPQQVLLEPGLVLYLPTGTKHSARSEESISLHVTVGINQLTWRGLVRRSLEPILAQVTDEHLPAGHLADPRALRDGLAEQLTALAEQIRGLNPDEAVRTEQARFLTTRLPAVSGGLLDRAREIDDHTPLELRGICEPLPPQGDRMRVLLGDRHLDVPAWLAGAFAQIVQWGRFTPADLDEELDASSRLVLCRRLVREGALRVAAARPKRSWPSTDNRPSSDSDSDDFSM